MDDVSQIVQTVIVAIIGGGLILYILAIFFCRGRKKKITVVNKRTTEYQGLNTTRSKMTAVQHYTIDCRYEGSTKMHTLSCSFSAYDDMKIGKSYIVTVRLLEITKIHNDE